MKCSRCSEEQKDFVCTKCMGEMGMRRCPSCLSCLFNEEKCDFCTNNNLVQKSDDYEDDFAAEEDWDEEEEDWDEEEEDWDEDEDDD